MLSLHIRNTRSLGGFMFCATHTNNNASHVCTYCGQLMCPSCGTALPSGRFICSDECAERQLAFEANIALIRSKTIRQNKVGGWSCLLLGFGALLYTLLPLGSADWSLALWTGPFGLLLLLTGAWYLRVAKA